MDSCATEDDSIEASASAAPRGHILPALSNGDAENVACVETTPNTSNDEDALIFIVCAAQPPISVDLSLSLAKRLAAYKLPNAAVRLMCRNFQRFAILFRVAMACFLGLFFLPHGAGRSGLSAMMPLSSLSVVTTMLLLSTDIVFRLRDNYEFWFLTVMNTLNWIVIALVLEDIRILGCFTAWLAYQSVIVVDANHRTYATTLSSTIASTPILIGLAVLVAVQSIEDAHYFDLHVQGRKIGDASDLVTFTTSTLVLFFIRLLINKKQRAHATVRGFTRIPCATLKMTLRLVPSNKIPLADDVDRLNPPQQRASAARQQLMMSRLPINRVDSRRTVLPYLLWSIPPRWVARNSTVARAAFYGIGVFAYSTLTFVTFCRFYALFVRSTEISSTSTGTSTPPKLATFLGPAYWILLVLSSVSTGFFCGSFFLFYHRDLLRTLLWNFDFVFTACQPLIFHACLCDANYWEPDAVVMALMWDVWFFWCISLDALTPLVKHHIFRFQKRFAAPILGSVIIGTAGTSAFVLFIPDLGFRDRIIWSYALSSSVTFNIRSLAVLLGRSVTIVLWSSRQAYLLFARREDELNMIRGGVEYSTPFPLISSTMIRTFVSTRSIATLPLLPSPESANTRLDKSNRSVYVERKSSFQLGTDRS